MTMPKLADVDATTIIENANSLLAVRNGVVVKVPFALVKDTIVVGDTAAATFTSLTDTPSSYINQKGKLVAVNDTEVGLEFIDAPTSLPAGGAAGQVLTKNSTTEGDAGWGDVVSSFVGLSDTPSSYTGQAGKLAAVKSDSSGLEFVSVPAGSYTIVDLTSATNDYALAPGEVAKITYSSATSVPLHIATEAGEYELKLSAAPVLTSCTDGAGYLNPNNTTYSNAIKRQYLSGFSPSTVTTSQATESAFIANAHRAISTRLHISTTTTGKHVLGQLGYLSNTGVHTIQTNASIWTDTTTVWSSLGTITFANAQSGTITVRRII